MIINSTLKDISTLKSTLEKSQIIPFNIKKEGLQEFEKKDKLDKKHGVPSQNKFQI